MKINSQIFQKPDELSRNILLSPDKKILYFSIPKCACSTIKVFLRTLYGQDPTEARKNPHSVDNTPLLNYSHLDGDNELAKLIEDESVFKFSVIRDPRSRVFSAYKNKFIDESIENQIIFLKQLGSIDEDYLDGNKTLSFDYFLKLIGGQTSLEMNEHWRPMTAQLLGLGPDKVSLYSLNEVSLALQRIESFVGISNKYETPGLSFAPHATNSSKAKLILNQSSIDIISDIYKKDFYLYLYRSSYLSL